MSISTQISRIQTDRNTIRAKLVELGLVASTATLDACATAIEAIVNRGSVSATVQEGDTYTIPAGYHNGTGTVSGVAGGGNYSLQSKTVTPTKSQQAITPDSGYYGLSDVNVAAIPEIYQDVSAVTAAAANVLTGKIFVTADGVVTTGTMKNNGAVNKVLDTSTTKYTIAVGYHSGSGTVSITLEEKSVTPTKSAQTITPASGKVLSKVTVAAIPDAYQDVTEVTAGAADVLTGKKIVDAEGNVIEGAMPNIGTDGKTLTLDELSYTIPKGYHSGSGKVLVAPKIITVTPTKQKTSYGESSLISSVTVEAIPDAYQDVTGVTAAAANVLEDKYFVTSDGTKTEGTMANNGDTSTSIDGLTATSATIPAGYTSGGTISLTDDIEEALAAI